MTNVARVAEIIDQLDPARKSAIVNLVEIKVEEDMNKVLLQLEKMDKKFAARLDAMDEKFTARLGAIESKYSHLQWFISGVVLFLVGIIVHLLR